MLHLGLAVLAWVSGCDQPLNISKFNRVYIHRWASLVAQPVTRETWVWSLGWEGPLEEREWQPTPVFLPGGSPWTEEPGRLQSMGSQRADMTEQLSTHTLRCKDKFNVCTYDFPSVFNDKVFQWLTLETFCVLFLWNYKQRETFTHKRTFLF